ncbi:MAG: helix-turn-helix transcriptional regulator [Moorella sp. (in: firmicutes)]
MAIFPERLKKLREDKGLSQREIARLLGFAPSTIAMYETNKRTPDPETLQKLADFFGVSVDYLLGRTDDPHPPEQKIAAAISDDQELLDFWKELQKRNDLQILFKQVKTLSPATIKRIIRYIKMVEDEEAQEDI